MATGKSGIGSKILFKSSKDGLNVDNIYKISIKNYSMLAVTVIDDNFGNIIVNPNETVLVDAHPDYPFNVAIKIEFSELAPITDRISIIYTRVVWQA